MIVNIITGGLGNQMFQYAAARALSIRNNTALVLNTKLGFKRDTTYHRVFALDKLNVKYSQNRLLSFDFPGGDILEKLSRRLGRHILCPWYKFISDKKVTSEDLIKNAHKYRNVILFGYFMHQKYFEDQLDVIQNDFSLTQPVPHIVQRYIDEIDNFDGVTIAVGIRVYQEINDESVRNRFFYAQADFYNKAMAYCFSKYGKVRFLIFTQKTDWAKENLDLHKYDCQFVETGSTDSTAVFDMMLMSKCCHFIISNSTFYYWGAYLSQNPKKEIIAPKRWTDSTMPEWTTI
jgi:putative LPS biosynthesis related alpha-1,2-fucosyltransferase